MMGYRRGDAWKIAALLVLIVAAFAVSFRTLGRAMSPRPRPVQTPPILPPRTDGQPGARGSEMFAPRQQATSHLLIRAHAARDPFQPYLTLPGPDRPTKRGSASTRSSASAQPAETQELGFRLVGVVLSTHPMAALVSQDKHYYLRVGDSLPEGWRVSHIDQRGVALVKGQSRVRLTLAREPGA